MLFGVGRGLERVLSATNISRRGAAVQLSERLIQSSDPFPRRLSVGLKFSENAAHLGVRQDRGLADLQGAPVLLT